MMQDEDDGGSNAGKEEKVEGKQVNVNSKHVVISFEASE